MKIAVFTDPHVHNYKQFNIDDSRLDNSISAINEVFFYCEKNNIKSILFCGDLFHNQKLLPTVAVNKITHLFKYWEHRGIEFIAISGNHDFATKSLYDNGEYTGQSALVHLYHSISYFTLLDGKAVVLEGANNIVCFGIPYLDYPEHFTDAVEHLSESTNDTDFNILLIHQTPSGLIDFDIPFDCDPNSKIFDKFDLILCGHIHIKRKLNDKFHLVGNLLPQNFGDNQDAGFILLDIEDDFGSSVGYEFIPLNYPRFEKVLEGEQPTHSKNYIKIIPKITSKLDLGDKGDIADFQVNLTKQELVKNYWTAVDGQDKELLEIGLKFIS